PPTIDAADALSGIGYAAHRNAYRIPGKPAHAKASVQQPSALLRVSSCLRPTPDRLRLSRGAAGLRFCSPLALCFSGFVLPPYAVMFEQLVHVQQHDQAALVLSQTSYAIQAAVLEYRGRRFHISGWNFQ